MEAIEEESEMQHNNVRLDHEWVQVLINLRMKYARSFTGKRNSATTAWDEILREMQELGAPKSISRIKIKKKWMNLIAKYKQLKSDSDAKKQGTWPYFDQIDRAYSKNRNKQINEVDINNLLDDSKKYLDKEKFMRTLIDLRYKYRHLFTGKKYAAQKGWMVIQNYLPTGEKYSVDQIRKIWHNLVQRYKTLTENVPDHTKISWIYFQQLHKIMSHKENLSQTKNSIEFVDQKLINIDNLKETLSTKDQNPFESISPDQSSQVIPFLKENNADLKEDEYCATEEIVEEPEINSAVPHVNVIEVPKIFSFANKRKSTTSLDDLLNYMKERDKKRDEQFNELVRVMEDILLHLKQ